MKKLLLITCLFILTVSLYAVPPRPGANPSSSGCINLSMPQTPFKSPSIPENTSSLRKSPSRSPAVSGDRNLLVILVDFDDVTFDPARDADYYETLLGKEGEPAGSYTMRQYFKDMSNGQLNLTFTVMGPYHLGHDMKYYGENAIRADNGDTDKLTGELAYDAIEQATSDPEWKDLFSKYKNNWDYNGDGFIDNFFVIHAGIGEEEIGSSTDNIRTLRWSISGARYYGRANHSYLKYDYKYFDNYTTQEEYISNYNKASIGSFCHEYGHVLGLNDLYDTTYETSGTGYWSLMDSGSWGIGYGADPAPLLAWEKYYFRWLTPTLIIPTAEPQTFNFSDIESSREAWRIDLNPSGSQYLILEGKKKNMTGTGWSVLENGLLITHIDEDILSAHWYAGDFNNTKTRVHGVNIVEAEAESYETTGLGSLWQNSYISTSKACFRSDTNTSMKPYYGQAAAGAGLLLSLILLHKKKKKLGILLLICCLVCIIACDDGEITSSSDDNGDNGGTIIPDDNGSDNGSDTIVQRNHPNTNYYTSSLVTSKTGISGISITVNCPAGSSSGSFTVVKEE